MIITNTIKKLILLVGCITASLLSVIADNNPYNAGLTPEMLLPDFSKLTPEAASLGRYGVFQVSEYSGAANISIPLYTVKSGDISFPINLYYDCSGIKVEQDATFVGLGWNLSYGGMISHIVCGEDDFLETTGYEFNQRWWKEKYNKLKKQIPMDLPYYYDNKDTLDLDAYSINRKFIDYEEKLNLYDRMSRGYDTPDVYQASFCGHNLSFVIDRRTGKGTNGVYPITILNNDERKYKISYGLDYAMTPYGYPETFTITDDIGINYIFKAYRENDFWYYKKSGYDSYYLTKICGPDGDTGKSVIIISYERERVYFGRGSRPATKTHEANAKRIYTDVDRNVLAKDVDFAIRPFIEPQGHSAEIACGENGFCYRVYPAKIVTRLETIEFKRESRNDIPTAKRISSIIIKPNTGIVQRNISFSYDYFYEDSPKNDYSGLRLKLTGVTIDGQKYKFLYDDRKLPAFSTYSKDYWGYYNGANPNADKFVGCTPAYSISKDGIVRPVEHLDGSNRLASENLCNVGMLHKVIYPTGGYTEYEYETHRFNDKYYYPDASKSKISFPAASTSHSNSLNLYGTMIKKDSLKLGSDKLELVISGILKSTSDKLIVKVMDSSGKLMDVSPYNGVKNPKISETRKLSLTTGETYIIETELITSASSGSSTLASCTYKYEIANPDVCTKVDANDDNGGYSIGGGLRIKTIKNYNSDDNFVNGVKYEYSGGRLLSPTAHLETHYIDFINEESNRVAFSFYHANTEPSYLYICSLGISSTVGYDKVFKNEIDKDGRVLRTTIYDFHNYGYVSDYTPTEDISKIMQNSFYFNSFYTKNPAYAQGHMNGKLRTESVKSGSIMLSKTQYEYDFIKQDTIYYQKCIPNFIPRSWLQCLKYDLAFYRKFIAWTYLKSTTTTVYDSNGENPRSTTTKYAYNTLNYKVADQYVINKPDFTHTHYYYPGDIGNNSSGQSYLINKHIVSQVTAIDIYRNENYIGGSQLDYSICGGFELPVVTKLYSFTPYKDKIMEMEVDSVNGYDNYGNIREYKKKDGTPVTIIWSNNHQLPVLEIIGKTYNEVKDIAKKYNKSVVTLENMEDAYLNYLKSFHEMFINEKIMATAYIYNPWQTVSHIITPNGYFKNYTYDNYGRLESVKDANGILQKYNYNYKNK